MALLEDEKILAEKTWHDSRNQAPSLFHFVPELCRTAGVGLEEISLYTAGLGPGGYTGLRTSLVAARSYALPGRTECYGVSSGHAVAYQIFKNILLSLPPLSAMRGAIAYGRVVLILSKVCLNRTGNGSLLRRRLEGLYQQVIHRC